MGALSRQRHRCHLGASSPLLLLVVLVHQLLAKMQHKVVLRVVLSFDLKHAKSRREGCQINHNQCQRLECPWRRKHQASWQMQEYIAGGVFRRATAWLHTAVGAKGPLPLFNPRPHTIYQSASVFHARFHIHTCSANECGALTPAKADRSSARDPPAAATGNTCGRPGILRPAARPPGASVPPGASMYCIAVSPLAGPRPST